MMRLSRFGVLVLLLALSSIWAQSQNEAATATQPFNRFGIVEGFWFPELTCNLGVGWERIIFDWSQHQPNGPDDWHTLNVDDRWLSAASLCQREVVALVKNTPAWATEGTPGVGVPRGLELPLDDPGNVWANFMRRAAAYYASRGVNHFIILNEPDIESTTYGYEFEGELDDYFQMLKVGYLAAKQGNAAAVIHLAGTTYWHDVNEGRQPYMERLIERILQDPDAEANGHYFDVLSLHIYFRSETVYELVDLMRTMLDNRGLTDKTIWINETNAAPTDDPAWPVERPRFQLGLDQQAAYVVQAAALGLAAGAERIAVYKLYDQGLPPGGESFGLLNPGDAAPRPAYKAWSMVAREFADVQTVSRAVTDQVEAVWLTHYDDRQTLVLWARTENPAQVHVSATGSKAYLIDQTGNVTLLRPAEGVYTLLLPAAHCTEVDGCFIGGDTFLLVQPPGDSFVEEVVSSGVNRLEFE